MVGIRSGIVMVAVVCGVGCDGDLEPLDSDRNSQLTGSVSSRALPVVDSLTETISEDARFSVKFLLESSGFVNVQVENLSSTVAEVVALDERNYNRYVAGSSYEKITALSFTPLAASFSSEWKLLDSGVYYAVVDNTDRGSVKPPWNGVNDRVKFTMSVLVSPSFSDAPVNLQNDAASGSGATYARLLETSIVTTPDADGF